MEYTSLYRRFRPSNFDEVIGQDHIVKTLVTQIKNDNVGHAYLFTGTRGTGKTSIAKIFARAVNCSNNKNGSPCGECEVCKELLSNNFDILEIDAASNNSVEQIRELTDKINFQPTIGKFKVYIVDEVHMLSKSAFNALLKTLEEPPKHAIFVLATTEVHQIPATILSRCMRFDFRLVSISNLVGHLQNIYGQVGAKYEQEALSLIATAGNGSVRDTLSIADMCLSFCEGNITFNGVLEVLGSSDPKKLYELANSMLCGNVDDVLSKIAELCDLGKNIRNLSFDLSSIFRNIIFVKNCNNAQKILELPEAIFVTLEEFAVANSNARLLSALTILTDLETQFRSSSQHRIIFEAAAVKIATNIGGGTSSGGSDSKLRNLEMRIARLESGSNGKMASGQKKNVDESLPVTAKQIWNHVLSSLSSELDELGQTKNKLLVISATEGEPFIEGNFLVVKFPSQNKANILMQKHYLDKINLALSDVTELKLKLDTHIKLSENNAEKYIKQMFGSDVRIK